MTYDKDHKKMAKAEGLVLFKSEFDFSHVPKDAKKDSICHVKKKQEWGVMPLERAQRIVAILNE